MIDFGWLNIGSLVLGLIAWIIPIVNLMRDNKQKNMDWVVMSIISFSACGISLCFQIFYTFHKVLVEDWGALMDTMYAVAAASAALLIVTIVLNAITINVYRGLTLK
ncbi:hypothetical protein [Pseudalkalibacillus berkeleyi]|uniref:Cytochrome c oxidase subunit 4 n=1 Tax=Pseudalkalibacillus berkeleyi TaxID=1069813 RepID=A0ABS9H1U8_9BACL|nr:hypothetical protein [Pseudalkalibacillus berkeleyi]MCF6137753.1 hypothetical protein [Pseudalkalibacillus berkeleyi]